MTAHAAAGVRVGPRAGERRLADDLDAAGERRAQTGEQARATARSTTSGVERIGAGREVLPHEPRAEPVAAEVVAIDRWIDVSTRWVFAVRSTNSTRPMKPLVLSGTALLPMAAAAYWESVGTRRANPTTAPNLPDERSRGCGRYRTVDDAGCVGLGIDPRRCAHVAAERADGRELVACTRRCPTRTTSTSRS